MFLKSLSLINFKNIAQADLAFSGKLNCFVGDNGAGKTNVLDAIHFLSMCKSAFNQTDGQSVNHGADFFVVEGQYVLDGDRRDAVACSFKKGNGKVFKRNGKEYEKLSEHIGLLPVVLVSPSDTLLIHESGEERRRFLNTLLSQVDREYLGALIRYNRLLAERNKLLKNPGGQRFSGLLEVLDLQLVPAGEAVHARRRAVVDELRPAVERYYAVLSDDRERVEISYKSEISDTPLADLLLRNTERDRVMQHTTGGVHRDDIRFSIGGHPLRKFGYQGQQKS
ncbi:MAG: DNA replication and repair protein RecF, partial [Rikenellaceae bacterium]|nr:DNA replication and repair protein RecF [Rikenellaceae bacterium]